MWFPVVDISVRVEILWPVKIWDQNSPARPEKIWDQNGPARRKKIKGYQPKLFLNFRNQLSITRNSCRWVSKSEKWQTARPVKREQRLRIYNPNFRSKKAPNSQPKDGFLTDSFYQQYISMEGVWLQLTVTVRCTVRCITLDFGSLRSGLISLNCSRVECGLALAYVLD